MSDWGWQHWGTDSWMLCFLQEGKKEAEGNVRAALQLSSPRRAEPSATRLCAAQGTRAGAAPRKALVPQHTLGLKELPICCLGGNQRSGHPCPDDGSDWATTRGANMKEVWTKAFSLLLLDYLKSCVQIFWDKSQTLKIKMSSIYSNILKI